MHGKTFIQLSFMSFLAVSIGYFLAVDRLAIPDRIIDKSFKQFLLKAYDRQGSRIIIDGGSNATHGIDASMIENHFGIFTPNISDNGSYPLEHKILNLRNHLTKDDIVILSLEWGQYVYGERLPENYVASVLDEYGSNSFYYQGLPLLGKLAFVFRHLPYQLAVYRIFQLNGISSQNQTLSNSEAGSLVNFYKFIKGNLRGSLTWNKSEQENRGSKQSLTCDQYVLRETIAAGFGLSERFTENLELLQDVARETGARFLFIWPAVVGEYGNECYTTEDVAISIIRYSNMIVEQVERYGFEFLGDVMDSRFDSTCFLDTHYHIRHDCAVTRTEGLIHQLESIGLEINPDYSFQDTRRILTTHLDKVNLQQIAVLQPGYLVEGTDLNRYLLFRSGWAHQGKSKIWSVGYKSGVILKKGNAKITGIRIRGEYVRPRGKTKVWLNGEYMGVFDLENVVLEFNELVSDDGIFNITMVHTIPGLASGSQDAMDEKQAKYRLASIELVSE